VIKVMVTGGHMTSGPAPEVLAACQFSADELRAAADEAHRQGLPITAHAHGRDGIVAALEAGFDGVEHASFLTPRGPEPDLRVIEALAASGTFVSTCIPGTVPGVPLPPIITAIMGGARTPLQSMIEGGARIVIGPDAGIAPHKPHHVLPYAIAHMAQFMGNAGALSASTYHVAAACNLADRKGRLAPRLRRRHSRRRRQPPRRHQRHPPPRRPVPWRTPQPSTGRPRLACDWLTANIHSRSRRVWNLSALLFTVGERLIRDRSESRPESRSGSRLRSHPTIA